jgi:hypothetical protein
VLDAIHRGRYRVPSIQRGYEWDEGRVLKLLDSIMSGYPFGAVMVWRPPSVVGSEIPSRRFVQHFESTTDYLSEPASTVDENAHLVLDGQQRLQSLYLSFFETYNKRAVYLQIDHIPSDQADDTDYKFEFLAETEAKERPAAVRLSRILQLDSETKYEFARESAASIGSRPRRRRSHRELSAGGNARESPQESHDADARYRILRSQLAEVSAPTKNASPQ